MNKAQYITMFLEESIDNLQTLNEILLELEEEPDNIDKINEIFRIAHTIKGMASTMGFNNMAELTHKMEDVLSEFRNGKLRVNREVVTILFECLDTLEKMIHNIEEDSEETVDISIIIKELERVSKTKKDVNYEAQAHNYTSINSNLNEYEISIIDKAQKNGYNGINIQIYLRKDTVLKSARAFLIVQELGEWGEIIKSFPKTEDIENEKFDTELFFILITNKTKEEIKELVCNISEVEEVNTSYVIVEHNDLGTLDQKDSDRNKKIQSKEIIFNNSKKLSNKSSNKSLRVDLEKIDKIMNMVSELVIYRTRLEQIVIDNKSQELIETLEQVERTTSDLQDLVMKIRMLPLKVVFNRFPRMIRDLSLELKKEVRFVVEGADTELDRTVIDEIGEPLIHLLRNAVDHGIETKEERISKGKDAVGNIKIVAYQEGTNALIKISDDGSGINLEKVRNKAKKMGINIEGLKDNDIRNLIFTEGFSTNTVVTDISGRGVGMDVVKSKISSLGGSIDIVSEENKGSTFIIRLPLTLQIIQALLVKVGDEVLAISLGFIDRVIDHIEENVKKTNGREVILYRGDFIPLIRLNERLEIQNDKEGKKFIVIVKVGEKTIGLLVDSLLGQQEIVIKPLGNTLKSLKEYIGATILGNGLVILILDVAALI